MSKEVRTKDVERRDRVFRAAVWIATTALLLRPAVAFAQSPWDKALTGFADFMTGTFAQAVVIIAGVAVGAYYYFGHGATEKAMRWVIGSGIVLGVQKLVTWLF